MLEELRIAKKRGSGTLVLEAALKAKAERETPDVMKQKDEELKQRAAEIEALQTQVATLQQAAQAEAEAKATVEAEAKEAGADFVGMDEYLAKIKSGWTDVDVIITVPAAMGKLGPLGRVLGPRGLMPNPKSGTVTMDIGKAIREVKAGKIDFKVDRFGIIHTAVGKISFTAKQIEENANEVINSVIKLKPSSAKGVYIKSLTMSPTMGPSIAMEVKNA